MQTEQAQPQQTDTYCPAVIDGQPLTVLPKDLYIPPEALEVFLETFQGPLDLLLYLIKKQNLDILDIPVAEITRQYVHYIEVMQSMKLELAADYLVMAAMLAEIKSRMLLPRRSDDSTVEDEIDPRTELVERLKRYEQFRQAADHLDQLPRLYRDVFPVQLVATDEKPNRATCPVTMEDLVVALRQVFVRAERMQQHHVQVERLSVREKMTLVLDCLKKHEFTELTELFDSKEGRVGVIVTFLAILELSKSSMIHLMQQGLFEPIYVKAISA